MLLFSIPNGGWRHKATAGRLKAEGLMPGVPDIFCAGVIAAAAPGLFIEMKRLHGGRVSPDQRAVHERLRACGYRVDVCHGWVAAATEISRYLGIDSGLLPLGQQ